MEYRKIKQTSLKKEIEIREDGREVLYNGKNIHLSLVKNKNHERGFHQISIEGKRIYVHKLVAEAFIPNTHPLKYKLILHKDCNTLNNHFKNLEWGDRKKVIENRMQNGIKTFPKITEKYRGTSKISYQDALKIAQRLDKGEFAKDICKEYGVSEMSIARIRKRYCKEPASVRYEKKVKQTALRLLQKYKPYEIVETTGLKYHTLYRWNKALNSK